MDAYDWHESEKKILKMFKLNEKHVIKTRIEILNDSLNTINEQKDLPKKNNNTK